MTWGWERIIIAGIVALSAAGVIAWAVIAYGEREREPECARCRWWSMTRCTCKTRCLSLCCEADRRQRDLGRAA